MNRPWLRPAIFAGCLVPLAYLCIAAGANRLGANPIATVLNQLGLVGLVMLIASLACTPARIVFGWKTPLKFRKMLGLFGFYYLLLHFFVYAVFDKALNVKEVIEDVAKRPFILVGFAAFLMLIPLAATSTPAMVKRLGRSWRTLHRLAYVIAPLGVVHFTMRMKSDITQPVVYGTVVALLLVIRIFAYRLRERSSDR